jgi:dienelactone hydrolase
MRRRTKILLGVLVVVLVLGLVGSAEIGPIIPARNLILYSAQHWWDEHVPWWPAARGRGTILGVVMDTENAPVAGAVVMVSTAEGMAFRATTDAAGRYTLADVPVGSYTPMAAKSGYADAFPANRAHQFLAWRLPAVAIRDGHTVNVYFMLHPVTPPPAALPDDLTLGPVETRQSDLPTTVESRARTVTFTRGGKQLTDLAAYEPLEGTGPLPVLLAIYPGTPASWDRVSVPLAAEGYVVLAIFPTRGLDLEADMDDTATFIALARAGKISPRADMSRLGILGGSFTSLHVYRYLEREGGVRGAVVLGGIADLFAYRDDWERGMVDLPPDVGDIDSALMALGTPDRRPEPYLQYSAAYHLGNLPPLLLAHGAKDRIVPTHQTVDLAALLTAAGKPFETHYYPEMEHYFAEAKAADTLDLYNATTAFFARTVRGR